MSVINELNCLRYNNKKLLKYWNFKKNKINISNIGKSSSIKVWWKCKKEHEWFRSVNAQDRTNTCPYCTGKRVCIDNCIATTHMHLLEEWHYKKNIKISPYNVSKGSVKKAWWKCKYEHEWVASIDNRVKGTACPYCSGKKVNNENCLDTTHKYLLNEWDYNKNKNIHPKKVTKGCNKKVWWKCKYGHEWEATINKRTSGRNCPFCNNSTSKNEIRIYSELLCFFKNILHRNILHGKEIDVYIPELKLGIEMDSLYYHKDRTEKDIDKYKFFKEKGIDIINIRESGLKNISDNDIFVKKEIKHDDIVELLKCICKIKKIKLNINNYKDYKGKHIYKEMSLLLSKPPLERSLHYRNPELSQEWMYDKNYPLTPKNVFYRSGNYAWWKCEEGHTWRAIIANRSKGHGCKMCHNNNIRKK